MKKLLLILAMMLMSCQSPINDKDFPFPKEAQVIVDREYILHEYDCSNKSADYVHILYKNGYDNAVILIVPSKDKFGRLDTRFFHAVVDTGRGHIIDLVSGKVIRSKDYDYDAVFFRIDRVELKDLQRRKVKEWTH
jgi:hypothetical protein